VKVVNLEGQIFGRLTVVKRDYTRDTKRARWWCSCICGNKELISVASGNLRSGCTQSCGCLASETARMSMKILTDKHYNTYNLTGEYGIGYTTNGKEFYFDLEDYNLIKGYCWNLSDYGYVVTSLNLTGIPNIRMHRLVMKVTENKYMVDHIHHILHDNRKSELRIVTRSQNGMNKALAKNNTSGVKGVYWDKTSEYWRPFIVIDKKQTLLGKFDKFEDAVKVRKEAEEKYQGEYSYDNSMNLNKDITNI